MIRINTIPGNQRRNHIATVTAGGRILDVDSYQRMHSAGNKQKPLGKIIDADSLQAEREDRQTRRRPCEDVIIA